MSEPLFHGVLPALVTPFRDGAVDEDAFVALVERQNASGVHRLIPVGTTGELSLIHKSDPGGRLQFYGRGHRIGASRQDDRL